MSHVCSQTITDALNWDCGFNLLVISMSNTLMPFRALIICWCISKECHLHLEQLVWRVDSHCRKAKSNSYLRPLFLNYLKIGYFILLGIRFNKDWIVGLSSYSGTYKVRQKIHFCFKKNCGLVNGGLKVIQVSCERMLISTQAQKIYVTTKNQILESYNKFLEII